MFDKITIIDGKIQANIFIKGNNIYYYSNQYPFDINKYFDILKQYSLDELYRMCESTIVYKGKKSKKKIGTVKLHILGVTYALALVALGLAASLKTDAYTIRALTPIVIEMSDYKTSDIYHLINSSPYLTEEEKKFIYNEDFINDVLELINKDNHLKYNFSLFFNNIKISNFEDELDDLERAFGYYDTDYPSTIYVRNYEELTDAKKDIVAHEFIHLCQDVRGYNLLIEASAEIISNEYYNTPISYYLTQVKLVKKLMEIIGPEPVWIYSFTGDFSLIEERVKPYLTDSEYEEFLNDLTFDYDNNSINKPKFDSLEVLLEKLYFARFNSEIKDDLVISLIDKDNRTLSRYYFNSRYINYENSYYIDYRERYSHGSGLEGTIKNEFIPRKVYLPPISEIDNNYERKLD